MVRRSRRSRRLTMFAVTFTLSNSDSASCMLGRSWAQVATYTWRIIPWVAYKIYTVVTWMSHVYNTDDLAPENQKELLTRDENRLSVRPRFPGLETARRSSSGCQATGVEAGGSLRLLTHVVLNVEFRLVGVVALSGLQLSENRWKSSSDRLASSAPTYHVFYFWHFSKILSWTCMNIMLHISTNLSHFCHFRWHHF